MIKMPFIRFPVRTQSKFVFEKKKANQNEI